MEKELAQEEVWDEISIPWEKYRKRTPEEVENFLKNKKGKILDLGCGHGRNLLKLKGEFYCVDFSKEQIKRSEKRAKEIGIKITAIKSDISQLPFENNFFDSAIFIAALHCIETKEKRKKSLQELYRTLKPKAEAMITVWDKERPKLKDKSKNSIIPWKHDGKTYNRYYYFYDKKEFKNLLEEIGFKIIEIFDKDNPEGAYSKKNIIATVQKP